MMFFNIIMYKKKFQKNVQQFPFLCHLCKAFFYPCFLFFLSMNHLLWTTLESCCSCYCVSFFLISCFLVGAKAFKYFLGIALKNPTGGYSITPFPLMKFPLKGKSGAVDRSLLFNFRLFCQEVTVNKHYISPS